METPTLLAIPGKRLQMRRIRNKCGFSFGSHQHCHN